MTAFRPTSVAGQFYPADATELTRQIDAFLAKARRRVPDQPKPPKALIVPHAGYVYSGPVAASAYALLRPLKGQITRVVLLGPSHRVAFRGMAVSGARAWDSPLGPVTIDRGAITALKSVPMLGELEKAHDQEHSLEVHIPFLQSVLGSFALVPVAVSDARPEEVAALLEAIWGGPETLIVISTDLSHYLDYEACRSRDALSVAAIEQLNPDGLSRDQACGRIPVGGLLLAAKRRDMTIVTLDVRNSGDTAGPKDRVVGYGAWALYEPASTAQSEGAIRAAGPTIVQLAKASIAVGLETGHPARQTLTPDMPAILGEAGAVFVTLKQNGQLRGCIGSPTAWRRLLEDILDNAFKAAFKDPRFAPLSPQEWADGIAVSVSVLTPPRPMTFTDQADLLAQLRPGIDGLVIEDDGKRALFLPSVWQQLPDKSQFLAHLKHKAGMAPQHWSPQFTASRFQAVEIKDQGV